MATINGRSVQRSVLTATLGDPRDGMTYRARNITYETNIRRGEHKCWISTWQDWCHKHRAEVLETAAAE